MEAKFTKGPWHIGMRSGHNANVIYAYDGKDQHHDTSICQVYGIWQNSSADEIQQCEGTPNARLIAEAPAMVEAIQGLLDCIQETRGKNADEAVQFAKATLARAKGETV